MSLRLKEEERNEKAIRNMAKKTPNRRCINCNSLGPQYVCLNFWTFVCTQCSGIHREFTHRVKSVSMSKFTSQEVANLENGGNERAREIYFKNWDSQRQPLPDNRNVDRLREFIKMVYVERRFSVDQQPGRGRAGDREERYDTRRSDPGHNYHADSRSPPFDERYNDRPPAGRRSSAGYDEKRSPGHFETDYNDNRRYTDRYRDDRYGYRDEKPRYGDRDDRYNEGHDRRFEERLTNGRGSRGFGSRSPPPVRPVKEILGDDVPSLRVDVNGSRSDGSRDMDRSQNDRSQRSGSSSSFGSVEGSVKSLPTSLRRENSSSLIDFLSDPDPPPAIHHQNDPFALPSTNPVSSADDASTTGWATFDTNPDLTLPMTSSFTNPVQPVLSSAQLTFSGEAFGQTQWEPQWPNNSAPQPPVSTTSSWQQMIESSSSSVSQTWNAFSECSKPSLEFKMPTGQDNMNTSTGLVSQVAFFNSSAQASTVAGIPEELFSGREKIFQATGGPSGFPSVGSAPMPVGNHMARQKSINPFEIPGDTSSTEEFPSLSSMHAALPNLNMPTMTPSMAYGSQWNHRSTVVQYQSPFSSATASGQFLGQQVPTATVQNITIPSFGGGNLDDIYSSIPKHNVMQGPNTSFGGDNHTLSSHGAGTQFSSQSHQRLISQHSAGSLSSMLGSDSLFPIQPQAGGQRLVSHNSLDSLTSILGTDGQFPYPPVSKYPMQNSSGQSGNPFG